MPIRTAIALVLLSAASIASAATSLQVVLPASSRTGVSFSFTVTARNGSVVDTAYLGTVHFTSSDPGATLPADYTFTVGDAGTHTFSATMATSGNLHEAVNQTITATDTSTPSITGTHATTVKWGADVVRRFGIQTPGNVDRTVPFNIVVSALNVDFEPVPGYLGTVHLEGSPGMSFPADYTFTSADNGVHTFTVSSSRGGENAASVRDVTNHLIAGTEWFYVVCPELTATAGNSGPVCAESQVFLYGNSNQSGVDYRWQGPRFWSSPQQNPTAPWLGTYQLKVMAANGCEAFATTTVEAIPVPPMIVSGSATQACEDDVVTLTVDNPSAYTDFAWFRPGGVPVPGNTPSVQVQVSSDTVISVRAKHVPTGCNAGPTGFPIHAGARYPVVLTAPGSTCPNATLTVSAATTDVTEASIVWSVANATITSNLGWSIELVPTGTQPVTVTAIVDNEYGTCATTAVAVISTNGPTASVDAALATCPSRPVDIPIALTGTPPFTIHWSDGFVQEGVLPETATRSVAPLESTLYTITAVSDASCSGTGSGSANVFVETTPQIVTQPRSFTIPRGSTATLSVQMNATNLTFHWYRGQSGDRSHLVATGPRPAFTTPPLETTTPYWVEVASECGSVASSTAVVSVPARRRTSRH